MLISESDWYIEVGRRVRAMRKDCKLTQAELSKKCHLKRSSITHIENGNQKTSVYSIYRISLVLERSISELLPDGDWDEPCVKFNNKTVLATPKSKKILDDLLAE